jgi:hypothetical protein
VRWYNLVKMAENRLSEGQCGGRPGVATEEYGLKNDWEGAGKVSGEQACRVLAVARDKEGWGP